MRTYIEIKRDIQVTMDKIGKDRDKLRDLHEELGSILDSVDMATDHLAIARGELDQAADYLSEQV